jgi:hypothetical protein
VSKMQRPTRMSVIPGMVQQLMWGPSTDPRSVGFNCRPIASPKGCQTAARGCGSTARSAPWKTRNGLPIHPSIHPSNTTRFGQSLRLYRQPKNTPKTTQMKILFVFF